MTTAVREVVVGIGGGIAAYKACSVIRHFVEAGHNVRVIPTASALEFVGAATLSALSGNPVSDTVFDDVHEVPHVRIGQHADLVVIAPATADVMARAAGGRADDLLTATLLTATCPVLFVPAMHTEMWEHPATVRNVATLRADGYRVMTPASGRLTGADTGAGRMPEPEEIGLLGDVLLENPDVLPYDLAGRHIVVSAGGTREALDPVRFLGNRSSGKQGYALARMARQRGARVTLIAGTTDSLADPAGVDVVHVTAATELDEQMRKCAPTADAVIMAAAVADFRPQVVADTKIKKNGSAPAPIELDTNPDILAGLVADRTDPRTVIVGFAAETGDDTGGVLDHGRAKLARKGCDLLVVNAVGEGRAFGTDDNAGWLLARGDENHQATETALPLGSKALMASRILDATASLIDRRRCS